LLEAGDFAGAASTHSQHESMSLSVNRRNRSFCQKLRQNGYSISREMEVHEHLSPVIFGENPKKKK
jgi:hypothetical protein